MNRFNLESAGHRFLSPAAKLRLGGSAYRKSTRSTGLRRANYTRPMNQTRGPLQRRNTPKPKIDIEQAPSPEQT